MAKKLYEEASVRAIADAIRAVSGSGGKYRIGDMAAAIGNISAPPLQEKEIEITENGTRTVTPDGVQSLMKVTIVTAVPIVAVDKGTAYVVSATVSAEESEVTLL